MTVGRKGTISGLLTVVLLVACGPSKVPSKPNFKTAIDQALLGRCAIVDPARDFLSVGGYPQALSVGDMKSAMAAPYEALVKVGVFSSHDVHGSKNTEPGRIYSLTELGARSLIDRRMTSFCAAHYQVDEVTEYTKPGASPLGAGQVFTVQYLYSPARVASWARSSAVDAAFPDLAKSLAPRQQGRADLMLTNRGWKADLQ